MRYWHPFTEEAIEQVYIIFILIFKLGSNKYDCAAVSDAFLGIKVSVLSK